MAFNLDNMADVLRAAGLKVVEVPGWKTRGYASQDLKAALGVLWHHTATARSRYLTSNAPTLDMLVNGRSDLPGPLCNLGFGRDGTVYVVATGVANHAGAGSLPGVPVNLGNHYLIGIEMESSGVAPWDWTPEQLYWAPRLGAALEKGFLMGLPAEKRIQAAHYEYSSQGKIDPAGWPGGMDGLRASINAVLAGSAPKPPVKDEEMPLSDADVTKVAKAVHSLAWTRQGPGVSGPTNLGAVVAWSDSNRLATEAKIAGVDAQVKGLVGAIKALAAGDTFDEEKLLASIEARTEAGVKSALESIQTTVTLKNAEETK